MILTRLLRPLAVLASAAVLAAALPAASPSPTPASALRIAPADSDSLLQRADMGRIQGSPTAKVWLVEASDFECPYCKQWHDASYDAIIKEYVSTGKVRYAFLNFPLSIHPHALQAAEAAMCASAQGKFWQMHQALFGSQQQWEVLPDPGAYFQALATKAGVNAAQWRTCVSSHATLPLIKADQSRLRGSGVGATPTFFVGSTKLEGVQPLDVLRKALDAALAKAGSR